MLGRCDYFITWLFVIIVHIQNNTMFLLSVWHNNDISGIFVCLAAFDPYSICLSHNIIKIVHSNLFGLDYN